MRVQHWKRLLLIIVTMTTATTTATVAQPAAAQSDDIADFRAILTPDYEITAAGVSVPDTSLLNVPGAPLLPVKGYSVRLPLNSAWELSVESPEEQLLFQAATIPAAPLADLNLNRPENWMNDPASLPTSVPLTDQPDPAIYAVDAFYPATPVLAGEPVVQGDQLVVPIQAFPFQYNPVTGQLRYHPALNITVRTQPGDGQSSQTPVAVWTPKKAVPDGASGVRLRLHTTQQGIYRLTYSDLDSRGVNVGPGGSDPNNFAVLYKGQPVAITVTGAADHSFDPGDLIVFYAVPYDQGRYQNYNVYYFVENAPASAARMTTRAVTAPFTPATASVISQTVHVEVDADYRTLYERPMNADHFYDSALYANSATPVVVRSYNLGINDPVTTTGTIDLSVLVHGGNIDFGFNPDQSVDVEVNSHLVGSYQWEGSVDYSITESLPASWLDTASNQVSLVADLSALPGISGYWISPDWIDLTYPALADAEADALHMAALVTATNDIVATGFSTTGVLALDVAAPEQPIMLDGVGAQNDGGSYRIFWREAAAPSSYYLAATSAYLAPSAIEVDTPSDWASPSNSYDYVAIVGAERTANGTTAVGGELSAAVQPLLAHRTADGFSVAEVNVQDIYDEFSYGFLDPESIRTFLAIAHSGWQLPPEYVMLVGDSHPAYRGEIATTLRVLIPPYLVHVDPWIGEVPADSRFVSIDGENDYLPDMAIGRISANNAADVTTVVNKILAYESSTTTPDGDWQRRSVYVADNCSDPAGNFHALSNDMRQNWLPDFYDDPTVYYDAPPADCPDPGYPSGADMRTAIKGQFNNGALFLQWFGHGSTARWGSVSMFNIFDPSALLPTNQMPLVMHNACWTGYFVLWANNWQTLGETLLLTPGRGAIADYSPSGLHVGGALQILDQGMHKAMFQDRVARAGDVVDASKYYFFENSFTNLDLIDSMILFGDPALKLRLPTADFSGSTMEVSETTADPGALLNYTVTVNNTSAFTLPEATLVVDYPEELATVADANGGDDDGDTLTWQLAGLRAPLDSSSVITFALTVDSVLPLGVNNVTVPAQISSDISSPVELQVNTQVLAAPQMANSTLDVQRPWIPPGMPVTVTATLLNNGTAPSIGTTVTLTLPSALGAPTSLAASTGAPPVYAPGAHQVLWIGDVAIDGNETVSFRSVVSSALTTCGNFTVAGAVVDALGVSTPLAVTVNLAVPDVNCTGDIDIVDVQLVSGRWGALLGQPAYLYQYDLNGNDQIDVADIILAASLWN